MTNKKGAELAINVVIVAALALIILAVLIYIVWGQLGGVRDGISSCPEGCKSRQQCESTGSAAVPNAKCKTDNADAPFCCQSIGGGTSSQQTT